MERKALLSGSPMQNEQGPLVLEYFSSDDGEHYVIWGGEGPYPVWYCTDHSQAYFTYCLSGQDLIDKAYAQK